MSALQCFKLLNLRIWVIDSAAGVVLSLWHLVSFQDRKQHGWYRVLLTSWRKSVEHLVISNDVASRNLGSVRQMDSISVCIQFTSLCRVIAEVFIKCKQDIMLLMLCTRWESVQTVTVVCTLQSYLTPNICSILEAYNCARFASLKTGAISPSDRASSINTTSCAKESPSVACSSFELLPDISLIFQRRLYKFMRQFWWYLASCATMSPAFSFVRRSILSRIIVHDLTCESSWNVAAS